jgi:hypothetical protein
MPGPIDRDRAPMDQRWVQQYCDEFLKITATLPEGLLKQATLRRVECVMDLLDAWQKRNWPLEARNG